LPHAKISGPQGGVKHLLFGCERPKNECFTLPTVGKEHALWLWYNFASGVLDRFVVLQYYGRCNLKFLLFFRCGQNADRGPLDRRFAMAENISTTHFHPGVNRAKHRHATRPAGRQLPRVSDSLWPTYGSVCLGGAVSGRAQWKVRLRLLPSRWEEMAPRGKPQGRRLATTCSCPAPACRARRAPGTHWTMRRTVPPPRSRSTPCPSAMNATRAGRRRTSALIQNASTLAQPNCATSAASSIAQESLQNSTS
jgi:hypothetical protein